MEAMVGPNHGLSEIRSLIFRKKPFNADNGSVDKYTEEVIQNFEGIRNLIAASKDIEQFYPSVLSEESAYIVRRMWEKSNRRNAH